MNTLFARGFVDLLFFVVEHETALLLAVNHDDDLPLNRRAARILCMAHNKRAPEHARAAPQDPLQVLRLIEHEALQALREARERQDARRLRVVLETVRSRHLLDGKKNNERTARGSPKSRTTPDARPVRTDQTMPLRMPAAAFAAEPSPPPPH